MRETNLIDTELHMWVYATDDLLVNLETGLRIFATSSFGSPPWHVSLFNGSTELQRFADGLADESAAQAFLAKFVVALDVIDVR